jgi:hypothetical protein
MEAVALTETRVYLGRKDGLYAFRRQGGCAAERLLAFETDETRSPVLALGAGTSDSVLVARPDGLVLIDANGQKLADCASGIVNGLSTSVGSGKGVAVMGSRSLRELSFDAQSCSSVPLALPGAADLILGATIDPASSTFVVGLERTRGALPALSRIPTTAEDATGPCSITGLAPASSNVAVLDPACAALRFINVESNDEPFLLTLPSSIIGRAVATVPGGTEILLGVVSPTGGTPSLWVISN